MLCSDRQLIESSSTLAMPTQTMDHTYKIATHNSFKLLSELSHSSPVCGLLQVAGNEEVLTIMKAIASWVDITQPPRREQLKLLQQKVLPVLSSFILKCYCAWSQPS